MSPNGLKNVILPFETPRWIGLFGLLIETLSQSMSELPRLTHDIVLAIRTIPAMRISGGNVLAPLAWHGPMRSVARERDAHDPK